MTSSTHMAEALLLRATFYLLRGEMNCAMEDFEQLLAMESVDKHVSVLKPVCLISLSLVTLTFNDEYWARRKAFDYYLLG